VQDAERPLPHIASGPVHQLEMMKEIVSSCATPTSHGTKIVLLRCAKNNVQTNTSFAQRKASVSSLYLALTSTFVKPVQNCTEIPHRLDAIPKQAPPSVRVKCAAKVTNET
jgi:hypothetical protein